MTDDPSRLSFEWLRSCTRRGYLFRTLGGFAALGLPGRAAKAKDKDAAPKAQQGLIAEENRKAGALDWQLTRVRADAGGFRSPWIEGYCSKQSVKAGESLDIMVS